MVKTLNTKTKKVKIPKVKYTSDGRKYITVNKKRVYVSDDVSQVELMKYLIKLVSKRTATKRPRIGRRRYRSTIKPIKSWVSKSFYDGQLTKEQSEKERLKEEKNKLNIENAKIEAEKAKIEEERKKLKEELNKRLLGNQIIVNGKVVRQPLIKNDSPQPRRRLQKPKRKVKVVNKPNSDYSNVEIDTDFSDDQQQPKPSKSTVPVKIRGKTFLLDHDAVNEVMEEAKEDLKAINKVIRQGVDQTFDGWIADKYDANYLKNIVKNDPQLLNQYITENVKKDPSKLTDKQINEIKKTMKYKEIIPILRENDKFDKPVKELRQKIAKDLYTADYRAKERLDRTIGIKSNFDSHSDTEHSKRDSSYVNIDSEDDQKEINRQEVLREAIQPSTRAREKKINDMINDMIDKFPPPTPARLLTKEELEARKNTQLSVMKDRVSNINNMIKKMRKKAGPHPEQEMTPAQLKDYIDNVKSTQREANTIKQNMRQIKEESDSEFAHDLQNRFNQNMEEDEEPQGEVFDFNSKTQFGQGLTYIEAQREKIEYMKRRLKILENDKSGYDRSIEIRVLKRRLKENEFLQSRGDIERQNEKEYNEDQFGQEEDDYILQDGAGMTTNPKYALNTHQINLIMRPYPQYLGTIAFNQIPTLKPKNKKIVCFIMNTDPITKGGEHWFAVYIDGNKHTCEIYDSLADPLPRGLIKNLKPLLRKIDDTNYYKLKVNAIPDQHHSTVNCGYFSTRFLIDRLRGKSFSEASGHDEKGEERIEKWKRKLPAFKFISPLQKGEGFKDVINTVVETGKNILKNVITGNVGLTRDGFGPSIRKLLEQQGNKKIRDIKVFRQPIDSFISKVLNVITFGQFKRNLQNANYDDAMHLYMVITLEDGTMIRADKNHVIQMKIISSLPTGDKVESRNVGSKTIPLNEFFNNAIAKTDKTRYFVYDSKTSNCQIWIIDNLQANGLLTSDLKQWILQDMEKIFNNLGLLQKINKGITDTASKFDVLLNGAGKRRKTKRKN
jgi:hypothetical protein